MTEKQCLNGPSPSVALSVVIPMFNEEQNVTRLHERLVESLAAYESSYELVFVEDGSTDGTFALLEKLSQQDPAVRVVRFARNFGQQMAIAAGLDFARGDIVVLIDADLQCPPEAIPQLVDKLSEGYEIVYGDRTPRKESLLRRMGSKCMGRIQRRVTGLDVPDGMTTFVALDRRLVQRLRSFQQKMKFYSVLFAYLGHKRWACVPVEHTPRHAGKSKYPFLKLIDLMLGLACSLTTAPLRFSLYVGVLLMLCGTAGAIAWLVLHFGFHAAVIHAETALILVAITLFSGMQAFLVGILGMYVACIHQEVKDQPPYLISEVLGSSKSTGSAE